MDGLKVYLMQLKRELVNWNIEQRKLFRMQFRKIDDVNKLYIINR